MSPAVRRFRRTIGEDVALLAVVSLVDLLPLPLAEDYRVMASALNVTPDVLALQVLETGVKVWKWSNRDRALDHTEVYRPPSVAQAIAVLAHEAVETAAKLPPERQAAVRVRCCPVNPTRRAVVLAVVEGAGSVCIRDVQAGASLRGESMSYALVAALLTWLVQHGEVRRLRHGLYAKATPSHQWED